MQKRRSLLISLVVLLVSVSMVSAALVWYYTSQQVAYTVVVKGLGAGLYGTTFDAYQGKVLATTLSTLTDPYSGNKKGERSVVLAAISTNVNVDLQVKITTSGTLPPGLVITYDLRWICWWKDGTGNPVLSAWDIASGIPIATTTTLTYANWSTKLMYETPKTFTGNPVETDSNALAINLNFDTSGVDRGINWGDYPIQITVSLGANE